MSGGEMGAGEHLCLGEELRESQEGWLRLRLLPTPPQPTLHLRTLMIQQN